MDYKLKKSSDGYCDYLYEASPDVVRAFCSEERAVDIIGDKAEIGPYAEFPIKAGKFHFAGEIVREKPRRSHHEVTVHGL